jgi:RNA polymerase sigma-70 factor (family 1)
LEEVTIHTDDTLLALMANDDKDAFTILYRRYWESMFVTAAKALRSQDDAGDMVQEVFLSLWNRRRELSITGSLEAYLQTSVKYKAINYINKNITRRDYLAVLADMLMTYEPPDVELQLQLKELRQLVQSAVDQMPGKMRTVYELSRQQHLSHKEIAERLGISDETVKKHIQHAMQLIKEVIRKNAPSFAALLFHYILS